MRLLIRERTLGREGSQTVFPRCGHPRCATGLLRLWRSRSMPLFEGKWACSTECMSAIIGSALQRERGEDEPVARSYEPRIPLGLLLVEGGYLSVEQLRRARDEQELAARTAGTPIQLGEWLVASGLIREEVLSRVIAAQWGSPVLVLDTFRPERTASAMPAWLAQALGAIPVGVGRQLHLAFAGRIDRSLTYAVERITGIPVVAGIAGHAAYDRAEAAFLSVSGPPARFLEAVNAAVLTRALTRLIEAERPREARLVRVHRWYWMRLWKRTPRPGLPLCGEVEDLICTLGPVGSKSADL